MMMIPLILFGEVVIMDDHNNACLVWRSGPSTSPFFGTHMGNTATYNIMHQSI